MNPYRKRLRLLREVMKSQGIDAYIIPSADPHLEENIPEHWKIVQWLTGFTGSAATLVVTRTFAGLWTDSRYFIQAAKELKGSGFEMMQSGHGFISTDDWLNENVKKGAIIAFDGRLVSSAKFRRMRDTLRNRQPVFATDADLISSLWTNRPALSDSVVFDHIPVYSGVTRGEKLSQVRGEMKKRNINYHLLNSPADILWLLNIRGADVSYSPLVLCMAIISADQVLLFADDRKFPPKLAHEFDSLGIVILPYDEAVSILSTLPQGSSVMLSEEDTPVSLFDSLPASVEKIPDISIVSRMKAVKNETELNNLRQVMMNDGVALTKFFIWIEKNAGRITEEAASRKLTDLRLAQNNCTGDSFAPIVAWNSHGSLPHYTFSIEPDTVIDTEGTLLVDSGGQYLGGTTDVTRCIAFGKVSGGKKKDFTLALKGTIALAGARFPSGTRGSQLDILARSSLWEHGLDYGHGTGHGVGYFLNVHESPPVVSPASNNKYNLPLEPGMILSDEPGIYREGHYGFRTENLLLVREDIKTAHGVFYSFETLTLCYIDTRLVDKTLLSSKEITWLNKYHSEVFNRLSPYLDEEEKAWLHDKTREI
ncbi:MAG TPA: aminopeptidase P family protein [Bacteroidales bacterium]|nr:aminopeptidase P family protein [Bacteroidales bacterium]